MIKLNININPDEILPNKARYDNAVSDSLGEIANLLPNHKASDFKNKLWGYFKQSIWEQQGHKCAFCEKEILSLDDAELEHFRPKTETHDEFNKQITREAYWWLAYDHKNYIVSCSTCNIQKGNQFPIEDEGTRITANDMNNIIDLNDEGVLGDEIPYIINPRYKDPEPHFGYKYAPDILTPMAYIAEKDNVGKKTIDIFDLNRKRKNKNKFRDNLPGKRGNILFYFQKEIRRYERLKDDLSRYRLSEAEHPDSNLKPAIDDLKIKIDKKIQGITKQFLSYSAEFSGMCIFWLNNDTPFADDFIGVAA